LRLALFAVRGPKVFLAVFRDDRQSTDITWAAIRELTHAEDSMIAVSTVSDVMKGNKWDQYGRNMISTTGIFLNNTHCTDSCDELIKELQIPATSWCFDTSGLKDGNRLTFLMDSERTAFDRFWGDLAKDFDDEAAQRIRQAMQTPGWYRRYGVKGDSLRRAKLITSLDHRRRPNYGLLFWYFWDHLFVKLTSFNKFMLEGAARGQDGRSDIDGIRYEDLTAKWVDGKYATFSMRTIAVFDTIVLRACTSDWKNSTVGAEWRDKIAQDAFIAANYETEEMEMEFKTKLEDRAARMVMVDRQ